MASLTAQTIWAKKPVPVRYSYVSYLAQILHIAPTAQIYQLNQTCPHVV